MAPKLRYNMGCESHSADAQHRTVDWNRIHRPSRHSLVARARPDHRTEPGDAHVHRPRRLDVRARKGWNVSFGVVHDGELCKNQPRVRSQDLPNRQRRLRIDLGRLVRRFHVGRNLAGGRPEAVHFRIHAGPQCRQRDLGLVVGGLAGGQILRH